MAREIHFEPTLFVYLGTSPGQVGWRLKALLKEVYGVVPVLRHLWIDTDSTVDPMAATFFSPDERIELAGFNGDEVLANLSAYPSIRAWWPRDSRLKPGFIRRGANQIRLHGRLAFFRMFNDRTAGPALIDRLRGSADALQQIEHYDETEAAAEGRARYFVERGSVRVYIIFSTCGGTGSALSFDMAYLVRHLLRGSNPTIIGVAILPPVIDKAVRNESQAQREKICANTYAWFKESTDLEEHPYWHVTYPEGAPVAVHGPPFDLQFVVDIGNQAGDRLSSEDDVFAMIAQAIFLDTGSSVAGAIRGFNANVGVLLDEFHGRRRAYSSVAAASLIYPKTKILNYCAARLSQAVIRRSMLALPVETEVAEATSALLGRLRLRDEPVLDALLTDRAVPDLNAPAIRKAASAEKIRGLLAIEESRDAQERQRQTGLIAVQAAALLDTAMRGLEVEVVTAAAKRAVPFAWCLLEQLVQEQAPEDPVLPSTLSLLGLKMRLAQQGISEEDLVQGEGEYHAARERLRALEGGAWQQLRRLLRPRVWQEQLDRARNDCLYWLGEVNQRGLQWAAQREAANLYDQLAEQARRLKSTLARVRQALERSSEMLGQVAQESLKPATAEQGIYELALEAVDATYIQAYCQSRLATIDPAVVGAGFVQERQVHGLSDLAAWAEQDMARALQEHAAAYFAEDLENTSLLQALASYHGEQSPAVIEELFDRLVRYCHPFWQYNQDSGVQGYEGKSIIGVEDEHSELIPPKYQNNLQYEIKSTGFKHRIDVARILHGLPAFLLRDMPDWWAYYKAKRKGLDPLHILPEALLAEEVIPEENQEGRAVFAVAAALGYVVQIGSWYYFDAGKDYERSHMHPGRKNCLDQGREQAESTFIHREDLVRLAEHLVEQDIVAMGNRSAIDLLDSSIDEHKRTIAKMPLDSELRRQYDKEIRALEAKQGQLGRVGRQLDAELSWARELVRG